jgi:hypothetical protein
MRSQFVPPPLQSSQCVPQDVHISASLYPIYNLCPQSYTYHQIGALVIYDCALNRKNMCKLFRDLLNQLVSNIL